ncbi:MAG: cytochrome c maturation protein CcmE [Deltaproteobacteria bacterium]|nr:cytochrome c maturation protein CcmE [Deltaproteobacteria bacterium]
MKLAVGMTVVVLALGFFIFTTFHDEKSNAFMYYYTVAEAVAEPLKIADKGVRIGGKVVPGTIRRNPQAHQIHFTIADDKSRDRRMEVTYNSSIAPDTFKDESEVLVEGKVGPDGVFMADTLFAKCPSKYEAGGYPDVGGAGPMPSPSAPSS